MRIGIMSAMLEENMLLSKRLKYLNVSKSAQRTYLKGPYLGHDVVLAFSRWGKTASAITATHLINEFKVDKIIFTGVAGSAKDHLKIGDVVVASSLVQHDMDARPFFKRFEIPLIGKEVFDVNPELLKKTEHAVSEFLKASGSYINQNELKAFKIEKPTLHSGKIASGDKFFGSKEDLKDLTKMIPDALCVEMEGASVAQVCHEHDVPFTVIRTISDEANENASIDFEKFVKVVSSPYSLGIIDHLLPKL